MHISIAIVRRSTLPVLAALLATPAFAADDPPLRYAIDLSDPSDDLFHVVVEPPPLTDADRAFDFVAFAPGVHAPLHFGRFVQSFEAFDADGDPVASERVGADRWELSEPTRVARIEYAIEDSFDSEDEGFRPQPSTGTGIEGDYVLLNTFGVLGYFDRLLSHPVELRIAHDDAWVVGSALERDSAGVFAAASYRALVDAPLLLGDLSTVSIWVGDIEVAIFVHSPIAEIDAEEVLFKVGDTLEAAGAYLGFTPVERYVILMDFIDRDSIHRNRFRSFGALEHNESSLYAFPAGSASFQGIGSIIAHEFMHVLTPLHLRSTVIANFDYSIPTTDEHLWLYEGVTEWSAGILRLRGGLTDLDTYLQEMSRKIATAARFDPEYSLARLAAEWSTDEGVRQYGNIYQLGALTGAVLDLRLLELSNGERGLREVFLDLVRKYGRTRPFDPDAFFTDFIEATFPEIEAFFADHVLSNVPLPYADAYATIGVTWADGRLTVDENATDAQLAMRAAWLENLPLD